MTTHTIQSPIPGTFYRCPSPDAPPFKKEGDTVQAGDTIGMVEVMKQFSEVPADVDGTLMKFHVENESPIEVGAPLADIETD